jgi:hypothetical protein
MGVTTATIVWGLLVIGYFASTIPLARQGWGRPTRDRIIRRGGVVHHLRLRGVRPSGRAA